MGAWRMQIEQIPLGPVCLFRSLPSLHLPSLLPFFSPRLLDSASAYLVSLLSHLFHSLSTYFLPLSSSLSLVLLSLSVPEDSAGAVCQLTVARLCSLCVFPCVLADSPLLADPSSSSQRRQVAVGRAAACVSP